MIKQVLGIRVEFGGEEATGWLPSSAAEPRATPVESEILDVRISEAGGGFSLDWAARPSATNAEPQPPKTGDLWFERLEDAEEAAREQFGIQHEDWRVIG